MKVSINVVEKMLILSIQFVYIFKYPLLTAL